MRLSQQELVCFNSILDGKKIAGTHFKVPKEGTETYVQEALVSLREKGFLDENNDPTQLFVLMLRMLSDYKKAKEYVFINRARIALDTEDVTVLTKVNDGFDIFRTGKHLFFAGLLDGCPYLLGADKDVRHNTKISPKEWAAALNGYNLTEVGFWMQKFGGKKKSEVKVVYHIEEQGYVYDARAERLTACGPRLMRITLMQMLNIQAERKNENGKYSI